MPVTVFSKNVPRISIPRRARSHADGTPSSQTYWPIISGEGPQNPGCNRCPTSLEQWLSTQSSFATQGLWQCLETFLVDSGGERVLPLASGGWRPGMVPNMLEAEDLFSPLWPPGAGSKECSHSTCQWCGVEKSCSRKSWNKKGSKTFREMRD